MRELSFEHCNYYFCNAVLYGVVFCSEGNVMNGMFAFRPALTVPLRTRVGPVFHMECFCALTVLGYIAPWECT